MRIAVLTIIWRDISLAIYWHVNWAHVYSMAKRFGIDRVISIAVDMPITMLVVW